MGVAELAVALGLAVLFTPLAAGGALILRKTYRVRRSADERETMPTTAVADLADADGVLKVEGRAVPMGDERLEGEVLLETGVARKTRVWYDAEGQPRVDVRDVVEHVPFAVDDGTGTIPVDVPADAEVTVDTDLYNVHVKNDEYSVREIPERKVRDWAVEYDDFQREEWNGDGFPADDVKYLNCKEGVVEDGEDVYVVAEPTRNDDGELTLGRPDESGEFVVTDGTDGEPTHSFWGTPVGYFLGGVLLLAGSAMILVLLASAFA